MAKNIWSDFGFVIIDYFENGCEAQEKSLFDDIKNVDSPEKPLMIDENWKDQRKIYFHNFYLTWNPKNILSLYS